MERGRLLGLSLSEGLDATATVRVLTELRGRHGSRFSLFDNECGYGLGDGISHVAGFVDHALGIVVCLTCCYAARILPFDAKFERALKHDCVFISWVSVTASSGTRREFDGKND